MKSRLARLGVLLGAVFGLLATLTPPATADTYKTVTFAGTATLSGCSGLAYPGVGGVPDPTPEVKTGPKNEPQVNIRPQGNHCSFGISVDVCVKTSVGKKVGAADLCLILASGTVWGFCGFSTGVGVATLVNLTGDKAPLTSSFKFTGVGGLLKVSGGNKTTNLYADVVAAPTTGSCTDKTASGFTVVGVANVKDCNPPTTVSGTCI